MAEEERARQLLESIPPRTEKRACSVCRKTRICTQSRDDADKLTRALPVWAPYYCNRECLKLTPMQRSARRQEVAHANREPKPRFAYPCIGGPLDGEYACTTDFYNDGIYAHLTTVYREFNAANGRRKRIGGPPSMVFIHASLLLPLASPRNR